MWGCPETFFFNHCIHNMCNEDSLLFSPFPRKPAAQCTCAVGIQACLPPPLPPPTSIHNANIHAERASPWKQAKRRRGQNKVTFITSDFGIHEYITPPNTHTPAREINKQNTVQIKKKRKKKICLQPNRIDLKSDTRSRFPAACWIRVRRSPFIRVCQGLFRLVYR